MPASTSRTGRPRSPGSARRSSAGLDERFPDGVRPRCAIQAGRVRDGRHHPDGLPGLLPRRGRLHQLGQGERHPGRPGPWLGRGLDVRLRDAHHRPRPDPARPDLRALPQPRAPLDARLRHRLRRASARRGDPYVTEKYGDEYVAADRHLRHHQGQAGRRQGLRPRARQALRDRRADHQGHAAGRHGQGRPDQRGVRPRARAATRRARSSASCTRPTPRCAGRRHRARHRGPEAAVGRARRRRHHVAASPLLDVVPL
jgi:hypothetical protein